MIGDLINAVIVSNRSIGGIIPNITIREEHKDSVTSTRHPVQLGAAMTDHAYVEPPTVVMEVAWSNSSDLTQVDTTGSVFTSPITDVSDVYQGFLQLQADRQLIDVITGKRSYNNMLIKDLIVTTDIDTENALLLTVYLEQLIIVSITTNYVPQTTQEFPDQTASPQLNGTQQIAAALNSTAVGNYASKIGLKIA